MQEIDKFALDNVIINMDSAYQKFFKEHVGYPKFKSKHNSKKSYKTNCNYCNKPTIEVSFENSKIKLPKLKWVKSKSSQRICWKDKISHCITGSIWEIFCIYSCRNRTRANGIYWLYGWN